MFNEYYYGTTPVTHYPGVEPGPMEFKLHKNRDYTPAFVMDYSFDDAIATAKLTEDLNKMKPMNESESITRIREYINKLNAVPSKVPVQNPCGEIRMTDYITLGPDYGINYVDEPYAQPSPKTYMKAVEAMEAEYKRIEAEKNAKPKEINTVQQAVQGVSEEVAAWTLAQALAKQAETLVGMDSIPFVKLSPTLLAKLKENLQEKLKEIENSDYANKEGQQARLIAFHKATIALLDR